jgi:hypothetical protein
MLDRQAEELLPGPGVIGEAYSHRRGTRGVTWSARRRGPGEAERDVRAEPVLLEERQAEARVPRGRPPWRTRASGG